MNSKTLVCIGRVLIFVERSAVANRLFLNDLFKQSDDRAGVLLLLGESREPAVGGQVHVFVGARGVERAAQVSSFTPVELEKHAKDWDGHQRL